MNTPYVFSTSIDSTRESLLFTQWELFLITDETAQMMNVLIYCDIFTHL